MKKLAFILLVSFGVSNLAISQNVKRLSSYSQFKNIKDSLSKDSLLEYTVSEIGYYFGSQNDIDSIISGLEDKKHPSKENRSYIVSKTYYSSSNENENLLESPYVYVEKSENSLPGNVIIHIIFSRLEREKVNHQF